MKQVHSVRMLAAGALILLFAANTTYANPVSSWVDGGTAPGGGRIIVGSATNVGQLDANTTPGTSLAGNYVTLNLGSTATGDTSATVQFTTAGNTLLNNGIINAPNFDDGDAIPFENTGAAYYSNGILTNNTLINTNTINGGFGDNTNDSFGGFIILDAGAGFYGFNGVLNLNVNNSGNINGGNGDGFNSDSESESPYALSVGDGIVIFDSNQEDGDINGVNFLNSGRITAGSNSLDAISVDNGVSIFGFGNVKNIVFNNTATGVISGGSMDSESENTTDGYLSGNGVVIAAGVPPFFINENGSSPGFGNFNLNTVNFNNAGTITGGNNIVNNDNILNVNGGAAGSGVVMWAANGVYNITFNNSGRITGGDDASVGNGDSNSLGSVVGTGVGIFDASGNLENPTDIIGVNATNSGIIAGGNDGQNGYMVGTGFGIVGLGNVSNISFTNTATGVITGGNDGDNGNLTGVGLGFSAGFSPFFNNNYFLNNANVSNAGVIAGGADNSDSFVAGVGVAFLGSNGVANSTLSNSGIILGGDDNNFSTFGGEGALFYDESNFSEQDIENLTITNSMVITGGNFNHDNEFDAGSGIAIVGQGEVDGITFHNTATGVITGGNENAHNEEGGTLFAGNGVLIASLNSDNSCTAGVEFTNDGIIRGGNNNFTSFGIAGAGLVFYNGSRNGLGEFTNVPGMLDNIHIVNNGSIIGGNFNESVGEGEFAGISGAGVVFYTSPSEGNPNSGMSNILLENEGNIIGGNGGLGGSLTYDGGNGVHIVAGGASSNIVIGNCGTIQGGNAGTREGEGGPVVGNAGMGIYAEASGVTIYNWGVIATGMGSNPMAIYLDGSNNTLNLNGHSSVFGKITAEGGSNNVLNINFTGMRPTDIAALQAALNAQGALDGNPHNFTFTVRGVTYVIDPMVAHLNATSYEQFALTPNEFAVAQALDSATTNPAVGSQLMNLYNAIDGGCGARNPSGPSPVILAQVFAALSPAAYFSLGQEGIDQMNFLTLEIETRLDNLRDGSESIDTTGLGGTTTAGFTKEDDGKGDKGVAPVSLEKHWGFFARGEMAHGEQDAHDGVPDSRFTNAGLVTGVDARITEHIVAGLLFNYSHTSATLDNLGSTGRTDTYGGGLYAGYTNGGYYGHGLLTYARNNYDTSRNVIFPGFASTAFGNTSGNQFGVNVDGGYDFHVNDNLTIGPLAGLQYVNLGIDGFTETGTGPANLTVSSQNIDSLRSRLGLRMDWHKKVSREVALAAEMRASWQHEFLNGSQTISSNFIGSGLSPFSVRSPSPERDSALVGAGFNATLRDVMTLFIDYDAQAGQEHYFEYSVRGGVKFTF